MFELHRPADSDAFSDEIEKRLVDMVIAHKVYRHPNTNDDQLPYLKENEKEFRDKEDINELLLELEQELREQRMVSGDSCYIDPRTGEMC